MYDEPMTAEAAQTYPRRGLSAGAMGAMGKETEKLSVTGSLNTQGEAIDKLGKTVAELITALTPVLSMPETNAKEGAEPEPQSIVGIVDRHNYRINKIRQSVEGIIGSLQL